jgi:hypothetical protein
MESTMYLHMSGPWRVADSVDSFMSEAGRIRAYGRHVRLSAAPCRMPGVSYSSFANRPDVGQFLPAATIAVEHRRNGQKRAQRHRYVRVGDLLDRVGREGRSWAP